MSLFNAKGLPRYARLLPGVVLVGASLLVLKTSDLVHAAYAEGKAAPAITADPVPANPDYANGEGDQVASASQVEVLGALAKRRRELDTRGQDLDTQARMIAATETRVDAKIVQLKQLQAQISTLLGQRDDAQKAQLATLVKTYSVMKAADAAHIFDSLQDDVLIPVTQQMKPDILGAVLSKMKPDAAQRLTVKLADRLTLPATVTAPAPAPQAAAPAPAAQASAAASPAPAKADEKPATPKT